MQLRTDVRLLRLDKARLTRAHLTQKQKAERLQKQLKEQAQRIKELEKENEQLKREIEQSSKTKKRYQVALFDHGNFHHPASQTTKKKGGQAGHADTNREAHEDQHGSETEHLFAPTCGYCGETLARVRATRHKLLVDSVLHPQVVKLLIESERQWCGTCKREISARDGRSLPFTEYGLNTFLLVLILRFTSHASLTNIASVLESSHGLAISKAAVCNLLAQAKKYLKGQYDQLIAAVRAGEVMYNDETGWLVNGQKAWMWIMANEDVTVSFAAESRGKGIAQELYGQSQALWMHDGLPSYTNAIPQQKHLSCWAHLLRFAHEETVMEPEGSQARRFTEQLVKVYQLKKQPSASDPTDLEARVRTELDKLLAVQSPSPAVQNIQARLRVQHDGLIRALVSTPDGTNNLAERELRPMVINRSISNGSNTFTGMETSAILASLVQTAGKHEGQVLVTLQRFLQKGVTELFPYSLHPVSVDSS
ncbi:MAG: IS66 family transposase [Chloroflexota bacterium]|nr:IS66 family transposase [Chloroflexota bacterium]